MTDDSSGGSVTRELRANAAKAVARAGGVLTFLDDSAEPLAEELRALHEGVAPLYAD